MICSDRCLLCLSKQTVKRRFSSERVNGFQEVHKPIPKHRLQQKTKKKKKNMCQYDDSSTNSEKTLLACMGRKERCVHVKQLSHLVYQFKAEKGEIFLKHLEVIGTNCRERS